MASFGKFLGVMWIATAAPLALAAEAVPTGKLPDEAIPVSYALTLKLDPHEARFSGQTRIRVKLEKPAAHVWLHARELDVTKVEVVDAAGKSHAAKFAVRDESGGAEVAFGETLPAQQIELVFDYSAPFNAKLQGLYKVQLGDDAYVVTQMESISARYAFPGFDEPRFKTPFDLTLTVPKDEVAIANTRVASEKVSADAKWKTLTFTRTKPLPTYLLAIAVGPWDVVDGPVLAANSVRNGALSNDKGFVSLSWKLGADPPCLRLFCDRPGCFE